MGLSAYAAPTAPATRDVLLALKHPLPQRIPVATPTRLVIIAAVCLDGSGLLGLCRCKVVRRYLDLASLAFREDVLHDDDCRAHISKENRGEKERELAELTAFPLGRLSDVLVEVVALAVLTSRPAPKVERTAEDAIRGRNDLNEVTAGDLNRGDLVRRETNKVGELSTDKAQLFSRYEKRKEVLTRQRMTEAWPMMRRSSWQRSSSKMTGSRRTGMVVRDVRWSERLKLEVATYH